MVLHYKTDIERLFKEKKCNVTIVKELKEWTVGAGKVRGMGVLCSSC